VPSDFYYCCLPALFRLNVGKQPVILVGYAAISHYEKREINAI
jgi:hypothetical protein